MKHEPLRALQPRKTAKEREREDNAITLIQAEAHAQAVREAVGEGEAALYGKGFVNVPSKWDTRVQHSDAPEYNMDAAARVAYEAFVRQLGFKIGEKVSDASGAHRIPAWEDHKTFVKARWRELAQSVIDAATGVQRKQLDLTSAPDVKGSPHAKAKPGGGSHEQDIQVRGRQLPKRRATRHPTRHASAPSPRRVVAKRSK